MQAQGKPDWARDGRDWPHREASRFVRAGGLRWHVQQWGSGPACLLVHGTAASTHSWRDLATLLAARYTVVVPDLPGHAFTETPASVQLGLAGMAQALGVLLDELDVAPRLAVGHSAGAAILAQLCADRRVQPARLVSLNGALLPFGGAAGVLFSPLARLVAGLPFLADVVSWRARETAAVRRLIASTGSEIPAEGVELYRRLLEHPGHIAAVVQMMARWDLRPLQSRLAALEVPVTLVSGERDRAVSPGEAERLQRLIPGSTLVRLPGLGHLAHEEDPHRVARLLLESI